MSIISSKAYSSHESNSGEFGYTEKHVEKCIFETKTAPKCGGSVSERATRVRGVEAWRAEKATKLLS